MASVLLTINVALIVTNIVLWRRLKSSHFLLLGIACLLPLSISVLGYLNEYFVDTAAIATCAMNAMTSWYYWRRSKDNTFLWSSMLSGALVLIQYVFYYFTVNTLPLPVREWSVSSRLVLISFVSLWVIAIVILI